MEDIFFQEKSKLVLIALSHGNNKYVSEVAAEAKSTYAHTFNLLKSMEKGGLLKATKKGRTKYVTLTDKGLKLAKILEDFDEVLKTNKLKKKTTKQATKGTEKLHNYKKALEGMLKKLKTKKTSRNRVGKHRRLLGRYRSLTKRQRPRDLEGKKTKKEVLTLISQLNDLLKEGKR